MIKAIIIGSNDNRFQYKINKILNIHNLNFGEYELALFYGGAGNFELLRKHLEMSKRFHIPRKIIITINEDCKFKSTINDFTRSIQICRNIFGTKVEILAYYLELENQTTTVFS